MTCDHRSEAPFIARGRMRKFVYPRAQSNRTKK